MARDGTVQIRIRTNAPEATAWVRWAHRKQIPFAMSLAINLTAKAARDAERKRLPVIFPGMRSKNPGARLRVINSNKRQHPNVHAIIAHPDQYMADHATGAIRRARKKVITIPSKLVKRLASGKKRKTHRPGHLLSKRGFFDEDMLRTRKPKSGRLARLGGAPVWYILRPHVRIEPRWDFHAGVRRTVFKVYGKHFRRSFQRAMAGGPIKGPKMGPVDPREAAGIKNLPKSTLGL